MGYQKEKKDPNPLWVFAVIAVKSLIFTWLWVPVYTFRCLLVHFLPKWDSSYGKVLDHCDSNLEEEYTEQPPKNTIIFTFVLDAPIISVLELRDLFTRNVLQVKLKGQNKLRYPEFRQYQTSVLGYKFWKDDPTFSLNHHIIELPYCAQFENMPKLHSQLMNKLYPKKRSPWDMTLVKNYKNDASKALLVMRVHHSLADAKSCLKVLVECMGEKPLSLPNVVYKVEPLWERFWFYMGIPFHYVYTQVYLHYHALKGYKCPLRYNQEDETPLNVGISKQISMSDVKAVAKKHNVTTSAVVMAAIAGGVSKIHEKLSQQDTPCRWVLPKDGHPDTLTNYSFSGTMTLPTHLPTPLQRLKKCQEIFMGFKTLSSRNMQKYEKHILLQTGTWFNPLRMKWIKNKTFPLVLTNVAGEREGFSLGESMVSECTMTCAPRVGASGIIIAGFSYKDVIEFSATAKDAILNEAQTQRLAELMGEEIEHLNMA